MNRDMLWSTKAQRNVVFVVTGVLRIAAGAFAGVMLEFVAKKMLAFRLKGWSEMHQKSTVTTRFVKTLLGRWAWVVSPMLMLGLVACGGGSGDLTKGASAAGTASRVPNQATELSSLTKIAELPRRAFARSQASPLKDANTQQKSLAPTSPVFRFFNTVTGAHFYTINESERNNVLSNGGNNNFEYEGPAFSAVPNGSSASELSPVHRFFNQLKGVHFYTIDESERVSVFNNPSLKHYIYEGIAYYANKSAGVGRKALYRFFVSKEGFHFYTASLEERDWILQNLSDKLVYEGIGYYVMDPETQFANPVLPHSGVTENQCFESNSNALIPCASSGAIALNSQQDGHRTSVNPMSFSAIPGRSLTECVRDNVTGLVWEGKEASGYFGGSQGFTSLNNGELYDAFTYVLVANYYATCGYYDWRLPTRGELLTIVNYGSTSPKVNLSWFPNAGAPDDRYLTSESNLAAAGNMWTVGLDGASSSAGESYLSTKLVRLVRGAPRAGQRFVIGSVPYPGDAANNMVLDTRTGLQWRRCLEGQFWDGLGCPGWTRRYYYETAMQNANALAGWRVPNIKELSSLTDLQGSSVYDNSAFPGVSEYWNWSSTPLSEDSEAVMTVEFLTGAVIRSALTFAGAIPNYAAVRLVHEVP